MAPRRKAEDVVPAKAAPARHAVMRMSCILQAREGMGVGER